MEIKATAVRGLEQAIIHLGSLAEEKMENATTAEEYAFLLGNLNIAAALTKALHDSKCQVHISMNYKNAKKAYQSAKREYEEEQAQEYHQTSMDELFPKLFETLKAVFEEKTQKHKKPSTNKKSNKKE